MKTTFDSGSPEEAQAELLLQMASGWARVEARKTWATVDQIPPLKQDTVVGIILASVRRELRNPNRVIYEVHGPDSASYNQNAVPPGFFTHEEREFLIGCRKHSGLWSQSTYRDDVSTTIGYLYATNPGIPMPMYAPWDPGWDSSVHL
jgi:hypothetical protein